MQMVWDKKYEVGHARIDSEHRTFLELVTSFSDKIAQRASDEYLLRQLGEIATYADFHFASEESLMEECGYPDKARHARLHAALLRDFHAKTNHFSLGRISAHEVFEFLFQWFAHHSAQEDKQLALYIERP